MRLLLLSASGILSLCGFVWLRLPSAVTRGESVVVEAGYRHLGDNAKGFDAAPGKGEGRFVEWSFQIGAYSGEATLQLEQQDVQDPWSITINGTRVATMRIAPKLEKRVYTVPAGALREGENRLRIEADKWKKDTNNDDIVVGKVTLTTAPVREALALEKVTLRVVDADTGKAIPARVTVTDTTLKLVDLWFAESERTAVRPGVLYLGERGADVEVSRGALRFHATRGAEWSMDVKEVAISGAGTPEVKLAIRREVDTRGFVAADTHIHTYTISGHGDSTLEERMLTLAGEGVELAIATDHNHQTDYRPFQEKAELTPYFTAVTGNEVTTSHAHMNAFPLPPKGAKPDSAEKDWVKLVEDIRAKGAKVVILNHPRWSDEAPFKWQQLDSTTGARAAGPARYPVDGIELANATSLLKDPMTLFTDWFALLNHGERFFAVGSSDSHTVGENVGQGRTYVPSTTDDPSRIDVDGACSEFVRGTTTIGLGIFCDVKVQKTARPGSMVRPEGERIGASLRVAAPGWIRPRTARIFVNGHLALETRVPAEDGKPTDVTMELDVPVPSHDAYLVCVVIGDGVSGPWWKTEYPYTLAATNPVWLDADGDGKFRCALELADAILTRGGSDPKAIAALLATHDDAVGIQLLWRLRTQFGGLFRREAGAVLSALPQPRKRLSDFVK